jgi:transcription initiation factor TFIID subunit TAF12
VLPALISEVRDFRKDVIDEVLVRLALGEVDEALGVCDSVKEGPFIAGVNLRVEALVRISGRLEEEGRLDQAVNALTRALALESCQTERQQQQQQQQGEFASYIDTYLRQPSTSLPGSAPIGIHMSADGLQHKLNSLLAKTRAAHAHIAQQQQQQQLLLRQQQQQQQQQATIPQSPLYSDFMYIYSN